MMIFRGARKGVGVMCDQAATPTGSSCTSLRRPDAVRKHYLTVLSRTLLQLTNKAFFLFETVVGLIFCAQ